MNPTHRHDWCDGYRAFCAGAAKHLGWSLAKRAGWDYAQRQDAPIEHEADDVYAMVHYTDWEPGASHRQGLTDFYGSEP